MLPPDYNLLWIYHSETFVVHVNIPVLHVTLLNLRGAE